MAMRRGGGSTLLTPIIGSARRAAGARQTLSGVSGVGLQHLAQCAATPRARQYLCRARPGRERSGQARRGHSHACPACVCLRVWARFSSANAGVGFLEPIAAHRRQGARRQAPTAKDGRGWGQRRRRTTGWPRPRRGWGQRRRWTTRRPRRARQGQGQGQGSLRARSLRGSRRRGRDEGEGGPIRGVLRHGWGQDREGR